jgi:uncharacterized integral membrane protein
MARKRDGTHKHYESTGVWPAVVTGLVAAAAVVIFVAQNTHNIALEFLWLDFRTSPAVLVLATALVAVTGSVLVGAAVRRRRRRMLEERQELDRLRQVTSATPTPVTDNGTDLRQEEPRTLRK